MIYSVFINQTLGDFRSQEVLHVISIKIYYMCHIICVDISADCSAFHMQMM